MAENTDALSSIPLSPKERDYAARTLLSEFGPDVAGQAAGMHVIRNRLSKGGFGDTVHDIITKPYAFEPWLHAGTGRQNDPLAHDPRSPQYQRALQVVDAVAGGHIPDITHGATHFYAPAAQKQLAMADNRKLVPDWASPEAHKLTLGGTEFYAPTGDGKRVITVTRPGEQPADVAPEWMQRAEERLTGGAPGVGGQQAPTPEWLLRAEERLAPKGVAPTQLPMVEMQPPQDWGAGRSFLTGATLGALPKMEAGVEAAGKYLTGQAPSFLEERQRRLAELQAGREQYQQYSPRAHMFSEMAGSIAGTALPMGLAAKGIGAGARIVGEAAPYVAEQAATMFPRLAPYVGMGEKVAPALETTGKFLSGQGGMGRQGAAGALTRGASYAAQGATQGAGQALLTQGLQPEDTTVPSNVLAGSLAGAGAGLLLNPVLGRMIAPLTASITPDLRQMALKANEKFGLNIRPTQLAPSMEAFEKRVIPTHAKEAQVEKFNEKLAEQVGLKGQSLTKENVDEGKHYFGQTLEDISKTASMRPEGDFYKSLGDIRAEVYDTTFEGNPLRSKIDSLLFKLYNEVSPTGVLAGEKFRALVKRDGLIDKEFYKENPALANNLRTLMYDAFQVSDPKRASAYMMARDAYRKLNAIAPLAGESGLIDPTKVFSKIDRAKIKGDLYDLAVAGKYLSPITKLGGVKEGAEKGKTETWKYLAGAGGGAATLGEGLPLVTKALEYLDINPLHAAVPSAILAAMHYGGAKASQAALQSPAINRLILSGKLPNIITPTENVLARGAALPATQVGAGEGR